MKLQKYITIANILEVTNQPLYAKFITLAAKLKLKWETEEGKLGNGLVVWINGKRYAWTNPKNLSFEKFVSQFEKTVKKDGKGQALQYLRNNGISYFGTKVTKSSGQDKKTTMILIKKYIRELKDIAKTIQKVAPLKEPLKRNNFYPTDKNEWAGYWTGKLVVDMDDKEFNRFLRKLGFRMSKGYFTYKPGLLGLGVGTKGKRVKEFYVELLIDPHMVASLLEKDEKDLKSADGALLSSLLSGSLRLG